MKFISLAPFVPSGKDFEGSKKLFQELGFSITWDAGDYLGFERDGCRFILQKFDKAGFAEQFMLSVRVSNVEEFRNSLLEKGVPERFGIKIGGISQQPYGKEVNIIDLAGVCWHFVE
jgi:hypothetical protein